MKKIEIDNSFVIYNADIFDGLSKFDDASVDLIFLDPPYNLG